MSVRTVPFPCHRCKVDTLPVHPGFAGRRFRCTARCLLAIVPLAFHPCGVMDAATILGRARERRRLPDPETRRALRRRHGASQDEIAEAVGVDRATISRWETGARTP